MTPTTPKCDTKTSLSQPSPSTRTHAQCSLDPHVVIWRPTSLLIFQSSHTWHSHYTSRLLHHLRHERSMVFSSDIDNILTAVKPHDDPSPAPCLVAAVPAPSTTTETATATITLAVKRRRRDHRCKPANAILRKSTFTSGASDSQSSCVKIMAGTRLARWC